MEKQTELEQMKALYAEGNHVCYYWSSLMEKWNTVSGIRPSWTTSDTYKLIHNKDADIAKQVAEDSSVEVEYNTPNGWYDEVDFFGTYRTEVARNIHYRLKQPKQDTISISDGDKVYEFEKPSFDCELLAIKYGKVIGWGAKTAMNWMLDTGEVLASYNKKFNLTPLKPKPTYEQLSKAKLDNYEKLLKFVFDVQGDLDGDYFIYHSRRKKEWKLQSFLDLLPNAVGMHEKTAIKLIEAIENGSFTLDSEA